MHTLQKIYFCFLFVLTTFIGTGTPIGDPTEIISLGSFFKDSETAKRAKIIVGSVKTNIGHLESAAGVAGLIKVLLMMKNETIVPSLMYSEQKRNPKLDFRAYNMEVATKKMKWSVGENQTRVACVNSFGFGGSNSHLYIRQWIPKKSASRTKIDVDRSLSRKLVTISNLQDKGLKQSLMKLSEEVEQSTSSLEEISVTSLCRRDHFKHRVALTASTKSELKEECIRAVNRIEPAVHSSQLRFAYVFCGVGTTWKGMCIELLKVPVFRSRIMTVDKELQKYTGWSIVKKWEQHADVLDPLLGHLSIFVCQIGIAAIWQTLKIIPEVVVGQSVGEVAACFVSGLYDLSTAVKIIFYRSLELSHCSGGKMMVVRNVDINELKHLCKEIGTVNIAVYISPKTCTISGDSKGISKVASSLENKTGVKMKTLDVSCAYHSSLVKEAGEALQKKLTGQLQHTHTTNRIKIISTVHGRAIDQTEYYKDSYWKSNVNEPVQFNKAIQEADAEHKKTVFIEIGPSPVLKIHIADIFGHDTKCVAISSVEKGREYSTLLQALATIYEIGGDISFEAIIDNFHELKQSSIPRYVFNNKSFPVHKDRGVVKTWTSNTQEKIDHSYIFPTEEPTLDNFLQICVSPKTTPYVYEHVVREAVIVPGALYADVGFEIGRRLFGFSPDKLSVECDLVRKEFVSNEKDIVMEVKVKEIKLEHDVEYKFGVKSHDKVVCQGVVRKTTMSQKQSYIDTEPISISLDRDISGQEIYDCLSKFGFRYGKRLKVLKEGARSLNRCLIKVCVPEEIVFELDHCNIHPSLLDGMFQATCILAFELYEDPVLPIGMDSITISSKLKHSCKHKKMQIYAQKVNYVVLDTMAKLHCDVYLIDENGFVLAQIENLVLYTGKGKGKGCDDLLYQLEWKPVSDSFSKCHIEFKTKKRIAVINPSERFMSSLTEIKFENTIFEVFTIDPKKSEISQILEPNILKCTHIVIFIDSNIIVDQENSTEVMKAMTNNLRLIQKVVLFMKATCSEENLRDIIIVTHAVHSMHYGVDFKEKTSLIGSEVWGFFRSIETEFVYEKMCLVDVASLSQSTVQTFVDFIVSFSQTENPPRSEYCIEGSQILVIAVTANSKRKRVPPLRSKIATSSSLASSSNLFLCSERRDCIENPFLAYIEETNQTMPHSQDNTCIDFEVNELCIHNSKLYHQIALDLSHDYIVSTGEHTGIGHKVIGVEMIGKKHKKHSSTDHWQQYLTEKSREGGDYVICYPCIVTPVVRVPGECCINLSAIKHYKPGLLMTTLILWEALDEVHDGSEVYIFESSYTKFLRNLIKSILKQKRKKKCVVLDAHEELTPMDIKKPHPVVALVLEHPDLSTAHNIFGHFKSIISLPSCLPEAIVEALRESGDVQVFVSDTNYIFSADRIRQTMPLISSFLKKTHIEEEVHSTGHDYSGISFDTLALPTDIDDAVSPISKVTTIKVSQKMLFDKSACYIVVGGLTGVGWMIVEMLAEMGAGVVVTFGRRMCSSATMRIFLDMQKKYSCQMIHCQVDIADSSALRAVIETLQRDYPCHPIKGIFQGAGIVKSVPLQNYTDEHISEVLAPKVQGTINLHNETKHLKLDYFVLLSSISSIIGTQAQGIYAGANSFLDTFANYRRELGLKAQSINWGAISTGMAAVSNVSKLLEQKGHILMKKDEFRSCFVHSLLTDDTNVIYANIDKDGMRKVYESTEMATAGKKVEFLWENAFLFGDSTDDGDRKHFDREFLKTFDKNELRVKVQAILKKLCSSALSGNPVDFELSSSFVELGIDSMSSLLVSNLIRNYFAVKIDVDVLFDPRTTIESVVSHVVSEIRDSKT